MNTILNKLIIFLGIFIAVSLTSSAYAGWGKGSTSWDNYSALACSMNWLKVKILAPRLMPPKIVVQKVFLFPAQGLWSLQIRMILVRKVP
ncbi:MAG: hypothetical protein K9L30_06970 [Desulfobacterales bacterium]|nr:hypothetical protein [Desulfobacterales bacterium]